jgi:pimeloyl-ACP methyl ester carboxylesterase
MINTLTSALQLRMSNPAQAPNLGDLHDEQIVALLRSGAHAMLLSAYFGEQEYRELCQYAKLAATRADQHGPIVYVLPGIMGSKLGTARQHGSQIVWLHPVAIANGGILDLATPTDGKLVASGVMLPGYLKLKLMLEIAGFRPIFFPFDWRCDLFELGRVLLDHMTANGQRDVMLVAHSMGGLVARAALTLDTQSRIRKLVQLGAPNGGSFAPVQALRAVYPTVRKIAALDHHHSAEELARKVFLELPGLYQMLPSPERCTVDLFDVRSWPKDDLVPNPTLLEAARAGRARLGPADERCTLIAGVAQETITSLRLIDDHFEYTITRDGDGTVPLALTSWPKARAWYAEESHGGLTNNNVVLSAVIDLLKSDTTERLTQDAPRSARDHVRVTNDVELRKQATRKVVWDALSLDSRRRILEPIISPEFL